MSLVRTAGSCALGTLLACTALPGCASAPRSARVAIHNLPAASPAPAARLTPQPGIARIDAGGIRVPRPVADEVIAAESSTQPAQDGLAESSHKQPSRNRDQPWLELTGQGVPYVRGESSTVELSSHAEPVPEEPAGLTPPAKSWGPALSLSGLIAAVRERNPTMQAAAAAWASAAERYPQAVALDDPLLQSMFAPGSFPGSSNVQSSYYVGVAQKIPWRGKLALRGDMAQAETNALAFDSQEVQLRLDEASQLAYFDYYLVRRELELNQANLAAMQEFRRTALTKYEANLVTQQDVLQSDVELARLESRQIELEQNDRVAIARINTLLHQTPDFPLPPPVAALQATGTLPPVAALREEALARRPELSALASRLQAERASVELACKEYYPDFEVMGRYDQFWTDVEQRPQVGMNMNIPLNQSRRKAAVREAMFRVSKLNAEYQQQADNVRHDVETAYARLEASLRTAGLYATKIIPAAQQNVSAATSAYVADRLDFLRLIEAERELIELQDKQQEVITEYHRRRATLERAVGAPMAGTQDSGLEAPWEPN